SQLARDRNLGGMLVALGSCPPLVDVQWPMRGCSALSDEVLKLVARRKIERVVLSAMWARYAEGTPYKHVLGESGVNVLSDGGRDASRSTPDQNPVVFGRAMRGTVERLTALGAQVVIVGPIPEIQSTVPETLAKAEWFGGSRAIGPSREDF